MGKFFPEADTGGNGEVGFGEFKQMIATVKAREAENRKSGESLPYLEWMLRGGGAPASTAAASPSLAKADKGDHDGDAGDVSSLFSLMLLEASFCMAQRSRTEFLCSEKEGTARGGTRGRLFRCVGSTVTS